MKYEPKEVSSYLPLPKELKEHMKRCKLHGAQRIKLPEVGNKKGSKEVKFTKTEYPLRLPFVIYADFKSLLFKQNSCELLPSKSFTTQYEHHIPCGSCIFVKCSDGQQFEPAQVNVGHEATEKFLDQILSPATICRQHLVNKIPMNGWA